MSVTELEPRIFNLPKETLQRVAETAAGAELESFEIIEMQQMPGFRGYAAEKVMPLIAYRTRDGRTGQVTIFGKRMYGPEIMEQKQYEFLEHHGIPTPNRLGFARDEKSHEILFFEKLDDISINETDLGEVRQYISMLARLNSIKPAVGDPWSPPPHPIARELIDGILVPRDLNTVWEHADRGELGAEIKALCASQRSRLPDLVQTSIELGRRLDEMPRALLHEDYAGRNTGWRKGRTEFVLFDVHRLSIGPRFWDAILVLGSPEEPAFKIMTWEESLQFYFSELRRFGGSAGTVAEFQYDSKIIAAGNSFSAFRWMIRLALSGKVDWTEDREEGRRSYQSGVLNELKRLLAFEMPVA